MEENSNCEAEMELSSTSNLVAIIFPYKLLLATSKEPASGPEMRAHQTRLTGNATSPTLIAARTRILTRSARVCSSSFCRPLRLYIYAFVISSVPPPSPRSRCTCCPCSRTRRASCTWATSGSTPSATRWPTTTRCGDTTSYTRWDGTRLGCLRKTPPSTEV
jgi:hypothetical protein